MKKKVSFGLVFALIVISLSVIALAAGLQLSPRVSAAQQAGKELEKAYGVTEEMLSFFQREEQELADGTYRVTYTSGGSLGYLLGTYTVEVKNGKSQASWSHDGEDTAGGYDAAAWGPEQMKLMMAASGNAAEIDAYIARADATAAKFGYVKEDEKPSDPDDGETHESWYEKREAEKNGALEKRQLSEEEMVEIGKAFVIANYDLTEEQTARLVLYTEIGAEEANFWYETVDGKPCFLVEYLLDKDDFTDELLNDPNYVRNNSYFKVFVNVETGVVEQYEFDAGVGGVG